MKQIITGIWVMLSIFQLNAQPTSQIIHVDGRTSVSLDGLWKTIVDPFENGYYDYRWLPQSPDKSYAADKDILNKSELIEYNFETDKTLFVPGDWNTQRPELYYYEGTVWYRNRFTYQIKKNKRVFLHFAAVNYEAIVYLNGKELGKHIGGFTPFNFEVTNIIKNGQNSLVVKVDNKRKLENVPTMNSDWWNYGGITRQVTLIETAPSFVRDYYVQLKKGEKNILNAWVQLDGKAKNKQVRVEIPELKLNQVLQTDTNGFASFETKIKPIYWSPENPKLYALKITVDQEVLNDEVGFRTIETQGKKILLNGKPIFLKGVCIHEEASIRNGRAYSKEDDITLLQWAKELGCNFVRLAHYPHNEQMIRQAEKMGLMVWSEIPVYWTIQWTNPDTYKNAETQLTDMITRDKNRANIIIWSIANETPHGAARLKFLSGLAEKARQLDPIRLISAAMETKELKPGLLTVDDELSKVTDILSFNQYTGWYGSLPSKCDSTNWVFTENKPIIVSEFGGGALYGKRGTITERFTEDYQEDLYIRSINMLKRIPDLAGVSPWILKDFRSPRRQLPDIQGDFNRKGLISDKGQKKKAFFVMKMWYQEIKNE